MRDITSAMLMDSPTTGQISEIGLIGLIA